MSTQKSDDWFENAGWIKLISAISFRLIELCVYGVWRIAQHVLLLFLGASFLVNVLGTLITPGIIDTPLLNIGKLFFLSAIIALINLWKPPAIRKAHAKAAARQSS